MTRRLPVAAPDIGEAEERNVLEAVRSGWVSSLGEFVGRFETGFAAYCEAPHGVAVSNGTDALLLALKACGVGPGDEVIVPDLTFAAVPAVVVNLGATPVLADCHPDYWCVDPAAVAAAVTERTRAIVVVHLYGHPADMDPILELASQRHIPVIEDSAEAHGATYKGRRVGSIGDAGTFSFYGNKIMTTGEGGFVTTRDPKLADRVRLLKDHAMDPKRRYFHSEAGFNCRMTNIQAALGCAQLDRVEALSAERRRTLAAYQQAFAGDDRITFNPVMPWAEATVWLVSAKLAPEVAPHRDRLMAKLLEAGVDTRPFFLPASTLPPYQACRRVSADASAPAIASDVAASGFNLPSGYGLTEDDVAYVTGTLARLMKGL